MSLEGLDIKEATKNHLKGLTEVRTLGGQNGKHKQ